MAVTDVLEELFHYGMPRRSGRYPWGSGEDPHQHGGSSFLETVTSLRKSGMSETDIAKAMNMSTTELRAKKSLAKAAKRRADTEMALRLREKEGLNNVEIGKRMGINESSVRSLLDPVLKERNDKTSVAVASLKDQVKAKGMIDVGTGVDREMGISSTRMSAALTKLQEEGYTVKSIRVEQATLPGQYTTVKVLAPPGTSTADIYKNKANIQSVGEYIGDNGQTRFGIQYPSSVDSSRIKIRYGDEAGVSGSDMDGVIQIRRGVKDLSLGDSSYAQVRIAVDGKYYMKGMALYSDDMPDGYDVIYNTNKKTGTPPEKVFKEMKTTVTGEIDPDNPFGAAIKPKTGQSYYEDKNGEFGKVGGVMKKLAPGEEPDDGVRHGLSAVNKIKEEGDWDHYSKNLAAQMLSKQSMKLITTQLDLTYAEKKEEYDTICAYTNPEVKKRMLEAFADGCDASAVSLKATALPRQSSKVIIPIPSLKDTEIYAPSYEHGETVALVRYPHGGTFEIPVLTVNNRQKEGKSVLGNATDAVGINGRVAERLSGADFDGDTVVVIPCNSSRSKVRITSTPALFDSFNTKSYAFTQEELDAGAKPISSQRKQLEMGKVSNLITDMTLKGAEPDEIARATKHSMVVIDAEKHKLNWQQSAVDFGIAELKEKYQGGSNAGASTLISRAKSMQIVNDREEGAYVTDPATGKTTKKYIDPATGKKLYTETGETYTDKAGKEHIRTVKSTKMAEVDDARKLSSGTPQEEAYAKYANQMKALANAARKELLATKDSKYSPAAKETYAEEVESLNQKLNIALKNAPRERQAQLYARTTIEAKKKDNPDMTTSELKREADQALKAGRDRVGAGKKQIDINDREWEAIQAGAISHNKLTQILNNTDLDSIKQRAMPRETKELSTAKQNRISSMNRSGFTTAEIAQALGVSTSTVTKYMKGK